jgi:ribosomal protein L11 methyltransferase
MVKSLMPWIELHVKTSAERAHLVGDQISELGAQAVSFLDAGDQPIYEPSAHNPQLWQETIVVGLFEPQQLMDDILSFLENQQAEGKLENFHFKHVEDQDWQRVCLDSFKPIQFGNRLWICPSWHTPPDPNAINVTLDPGLAFGTGTHATTGLCLEWLDEHVSKDQTIIDYGCGSGILAIAALKLGAKIAYAIDNDPQALEATRLNAERNQIPPSQLITGLPGDTLEIPQVDILAANILAQPLVHLAPQLAQLVKPNGKIVLSGILIEQAEEIIRAYQPWFDMQKPVSKNEWVRIEGKKLYNS